MSAFIGPFQVPESGAFIAKCNDIDTMSINVEEITLVKGTSTTSNARITLSNINIVVNDGGKITTVIVEHKLSSQADTEWNKVGTFGVEWTNAQSNSGDFIITDMAWDLAGLNHDFRVYFQNQDGELAIQANDNKEIGIATPTGAGWLQILSTPFNGFDDVDEYPLATGLTVLNASTNESGNYNDPYKLPNSGIARLQWDDMRSMGDLEDHPLADGTTADIYKEQLRNITSYIIFVYIMATGGGAPVNEWPDPNESALNGTWYKIRETENNYLDFDCPKNLNLGFAVACKIRLPEGTVSNTSTIIPLSYSQY